MMKPLIRFLLLLPLMHAPVLAQFEGTIESRNTSIDAMGGAEQFTMKIWVRPRMARVEILPDHGEGRTTMIHREDRGVLWMIEDADKSYEEIRREPEQERGEEEERPQVVKTGKKKKILGYPCEEVRIKHRDAETEIWGTAKLVKITQALSHIMDGTSGGGDGTRDVVGSMGLFPLMSITRVEGAVVESQEVTRITQGPTPVALFEIPAGYTKRGKPELPDQVRSP
jgi:hypothetical protein